MDKALVAGLLALITALSGVFYHLQTEYSDPMTKMTNMYQAWEQWKTQYGKDYSMEELPLKFSTFCQNYDFIEKFNAEGKHKFKVGLNEFAD